MTIKFKPLDADKKPPTYVGPAHKIIQHAIKPYFYFNGTEYRDDKMDNLVELIGRLMEALIAQGAIDHEQIGDILKVKVTGIDFTPTP